MNFRRVLLIGELETDPSAGLAALRRVAPEAEELHVVAHAPGPGFGWVAGDSAEAAPLVERLRRATTGAAPSVDLLVASELDAGGITSLAGRTGVDLVVLDRPRRAALSVAAEVRNQLALPILCV